MTTDTTTAAVTHLRAIREQWGDLLAAIDTPPAAEWPPVYDRAWEKPTADADAPAVGRLPLTLREHPAPCNLGALDAAMEIEWALFDLADRIASVVQRPIRHVPVPNVGARGRTIAAPDDINHADRWHYVTPTSPGSRANGLHWAAVWIEQRLLGEAADNLGELVRSGTLPPPLFQSLPSLISDEAAETIAAAHRDMTRALGRDGRDTVLPAPCPWCAGELTARTTSGDPMAAVVTCGTGPTCTAPAPYDDRARRTWRGADLCGLYGALSAAKRRASA